MQIYVDALAGNDSNDGYTQETAFATIDRVNKMCLPGNTTVYFKCGSIWFESLAPKRIEDGKPILFTSYGEGPLPIIDGNGAENAIHIENMSDVTIEKLEVTNISDDTSNEHRGVYVCGTVGGIYNNICIRDMYVHDVGTKVSRTAGGIIVWADYADDPIRFNGVVIEGCRVCNTQAQGITFSSAHGYRIGIDWTKLPYTPSKNICIKENYISRCGGDGIFQSCADDPIIEYNTVANCCFAGNTPYAGIWPHNSQGAQMRYNEAFGNRLIAGDGQGYDVDIDCTDTKVYCNYSHHNDGGFILLCTSGDMGGYNNGVKVENNISYEDSGQIITLSGPIRDIDLKNNLVIVEKAKGTRLIGMYQWGESGGGPDRVHIENNYFDLNTDGRNMFYDDTEFEFLNNNYTGSYNYTDIKDSNFKSARYDFILSRRMYGVVPHLSFKSQQPITKNIIGGKANEKM